MPYLGPPIHPVHCRHCHKTWYPKYPERPKSCGDCQSRDWDQWPTESEASLAIKDWHRSQGNRVHKRPSECDVCRQIMAEEGHEVQRA